MGDLIDLETYRTERALRGGGSRGARAPQRDPPEGPPDVGAKRLLAPWRVVEMPTRPRAGMEFRVMYGRHVALGENHRISRVNGRSFYVSRGGQRTRYSLFAWRRWLEARMREGWLLLDGWEVRRPPSLDRPQGDAIEPVPMTPRSEPAAMLQSEQAPEKPRHPDTTTRPRRS